MQGSPHQLAARIAKMERIHGASQQARERMAKAAEAADDWWGVCRVCGERVTGTLEDLRKHGERHRG